MTPSEVLEVTDGQAADVSSRGGRRSRAKPLRHYLEAYALLGVLILVAIFFSVWPETADTFPTAANVQVLIGGNAVIAIVAIAALIPLVCFEFDLSVGAVAGLSAVFVASALSDGGGIIGAILIGVAIGLIVGVVNALLVTRLGVNAVITTLGTSIIVAGVINLKTHGIPVTGDIPTSFTDFGTQTTLGIPRIAYALAVVAIAAYYLLDHTPFGRQLYAMGSSRAAAKLVGIRIKLVLGVAFVVAGGLSGAAGVLQVARSGGADPRIGNNLLLPALAAAFLSAAAIRPGRYNVMGTLVAVYFLAVINNGLNLAGAEEYVTNFVNGAALIAGVGLAVRLGRRQTI